MRKILAFAVLLGATILVSAQDEPPPPRYGVEYNADAFPQTDPKATLASVIKAIERDKADYLAAHLIDPKFIEGRIAERAKLLEQQVVAELQAEREAQRRDPDRIPRTERLPADPKGFAEAVRREAAQRAFRMVVRDIRETLKENPDHLKDFRRYLREGQFTDAGETATVTLPDRKGEQVSFTKVGGRWFVEDRRQPAAPEPAKK